MLLFLLFDFSELILLSLLSRPSLCPLFPPPSLLPSASDAEVRNRALFCIRRLQGTKGVVSLPFLTGALLSSAWESDLCKMNPFLSKTDAANIKLVTAAMTLICSRIDLINLCMKNATALIGTLHDVQAGKLHASALPAAQVPIVHQQINNACISLATLLATSRHYVEEKQEAGRLALHFDPRYLVFEYVLGYMLRKQQVLLVRTFMKAANGGSTQGDEFVEGRALVHQVRTESRCL